MKKRTLSTNILLLILCIILPISAYPSRINKSADYKIISGIVYDEYSKKGVRHATLAAKGTNVSTITNEDGYFTLKVSDTLQVKEIEISHIGYNSKTINLQEYTDVEIPIRPIVKNLDEVLIESQNALEIVKQAIDKIEINNSPNINSLTGFYRETAQKRSTYITIAEAVINMYKTPYNEDISGDKVQVLKGRTLLAPKISDTIAVKVQGGPNIAKYLDFVKNTDIMLNPETLNLYQYTIDGVVMINDRPQYVIKFEPQTVAPFALYYGKLYIDRETLTFSRAELNLSVDNKDKASSFVLIKKPSKMRFQVNSLTNTITYKQQNGRSYLNYINSEIKFKCNWKKLFYVFAPTYTITSEVVITDRNENDVKKISSKNVFSERQTLPDKIENFYDPNFWEAYNIIAPTESLESAVNKLKKQN